MRYACCVENGFLNGRNFAVGCLCEAEDLAEVRRAAAAIPEEVELLPQAEPGSPDDGPDAVEELEAGLAEVLASYLPESVIAAAMTMRAEGEDGPQAAILIGDPHKEEETDDELEEIRENLWCAVYPEGPGFVLGASRETAEKAKEIVYGYRYADQDPWPALVQYLSAQEIFALLYVAEEPDGTGTVQASACNGTAMVRLGGKS